MATLYLLRMTLHLKLVKIKLGEPHSTSQLPPPTMDDASSSAPFDEDGHYFRGATLLESLEETIPGHGEMKRKVYAASMSTCTLLKITSSW
jgi:hypothetical protein